MGNARMQLAWFCPKDGKNAYWHLYGSVSRTFYLSGRFWGRPVWKITTFGHIFGHGSKTGVQRRSVGGVSKANDGLVWNSVLEIQGVLSSSTYKLTEGPQEMMHWSRGQMISLLVRLSGAD